MRSYFLLGLLFADIHLYDFLVMNNIKYVRIPFVYLKFLAVINLCSNMLIFVVFICRRYSLDRMGYWSQGSMRAMSSGSGLMVVFFGIIFHAGFIRPMNKAYLFTGEIVEITVPSMGESVSDGTIASFLKR